MLVRTVSLYKTSFSGLSKETWLLSFVMFINRSGTMVVPFMTLYLTRPEMGYSLSEAGIVMGLFGLGAVIGAYFGGRFTDIIGFYKVQIITLVSGGIMFIVLGQIKTYAFICVFTFLLSLLNEAFRPANSSAIAFYSKAQNRTRSYSLNRLAVNLGWAFGTSVGGFIASINYELLFWVDGITNIFAALLMLGFLKTKAPTRKDHDAEELRGNGGISAYKDKAYLWFIFYVTLFASCFFQLFTTIPKYFRDNLHLSERYIGLLMALNGLLIVALEMVFVFKLEGRKNNLHFITIGVIVAGLAFVSLLFPFSPAVVTLLMILLITLGEILSMPFMSSYWSKRTTDFNRGQYAALYSISWGLAQTLGPVLCSFLVDHSSFPFLFSILALVCGISAFGFYRLKKNEILLV